MKETAGHHNSRPEAKHPGLNPVLLMGAIALIAVLMSYILPSGEYRRDGKMVVPGTYRVLEKDITFKNILFSPEGKAKKHAGQENGAQAASSPAAAAASGAAPVSSADNAPVAQSHKPQKAAPVSLGDLFMSLPQGLAKMAPLVVMVLFVGGMFGILNQSGAVAAGLRRVLALTGNNVYVLVSVLMLVFSAGTTFLGFSKEYVLMIPLVVALCNRMGLSNLTGLAIVALGSQIGHIASITNPYILPVAQPMLGLPVFSGLWLRAATYALMLALGIVFMLRHIRRNESLLPAADGRNGEKLAWNHAAMLWIMVFGIGFLVCAANHLGWKTVELSGYYLFLSVIVALFGGLGANRSADAFIEGMKKMVLAAVLIGLAAAVEIILHEGRILDTLIYWLVEAVGTHGAYFSAFAIFISELLLDVVMPSAVGKVAVSIPILGPMGELTGVSPQTTVFAFLMGNGLSNMIVPTSSALLIFLATAEVSWSRWAKFVWPLMAVLGAAIVLLLAFAVYIGY